ncbi:MAG: DNA mismatch repair protein MutS, partial [Spirochaetes bacterium]|nr:DNA mismatch repair protein MutS [Spirochaetota bacterium]
MNILESIRKELSNILDIERIIAKLSVGRGNARDLIGLKNSLISIDRIREELMEIEEFREEGHGIQDFKRIIDFIFSSIDEDPPLSIKDGGLIKSGYNEKLDDFRK